MSKDVIRDLENSILSNEEYVNEIFEDDSNIGEVYKFLDTLVKDPDNFNYVLQLIDSYPSFVNIKKSQDEYLITKIVRKYINLCVDNDNPFKINHYNKIIDIFVSNQRFKVPEKVINDLKYEFQYNITKVNSVDAKDPEDVKRIIFNLEDGVKILENAGHKKEKEIDDEKLQYKYRIDSGFSREALEEFNNYMSIDDEEYLDKTNECVITIDSGLNHFYEDACSIKKLSNGNYLVGVYVVDVDKFIPVGSKLHQEAFLKAENIYVPNKISSHMLPESLRTTICSFEEGVNRYALGYLFEFSTIGNEVKLDNFSACRAIVNVKKNFDHKTFNKVLKAKNDDEVSKVVRELYEFTKMYNRSNILNDPTFNKDNVTKLTTNDIGIGSIIVSNLNTLTNYKVSEFFKKEDIPFIFYTCPKSENADLIVKLRNMTKGVGVFNDLVDKCTNLYGKPRLSAKPQEFYPLKLDSYTTMTSPGRRYVDLLNEDRVKKFLIDKSPYKYNRKNDLTYLNGICKYLNGRLDLNNYYKSDYGEIKKSVKEKKGKDKKKK